MILKKIYNYFKKKKKVDGYNSYTIVAAVYNVEKYLDAFFESIISQTLKFEKHIYIIVVDDGSTDDSSTIAKKWQKKYPKNISYYRKENGGQYTAFNYGLKHVKTPWVTFIDTDDTVNRIYFEKTDSFIGKNKDIDVISCNQMFFYENTNEIKPHYLSYRFRKNKTVVNPKKMQGFIQATVSSVFFRTDKIQKHNILFSDKVKPVFYDGHFVNTFFILYDDINIAFLKKPIYFYRKRHDNTSIIDKAWQNHGRYLDALEFGLLDLFFKAEKKYREIPLYLQRYVLYQLQYYFKRIVNGNDQLEFLNQEELKLFKTLLHKLFIYIDAETIEVCALGGLWHKYRLGFYNLYKDKTIFKQVCYLDGYDPVNKEIKLHYYAHSETQEKFSLNGKVLEPRSSKIIEHKFLDQLFVYEKIIYIPLDGIWEYFDVKLGNIETQISLNAKRYKNGIQVNDFINVAIKDD